MCYNFNEVKKMEEENEDPYPDLWGGAPVGDK
jgi:hypothetical protein